MNTRARIATVCLANRAEVSIEKTRQRGLELLQLALRQKPDLACLPETFTNPRATVPLSELAEPVPGPTTDAAAKLAREHRCHVICPLLTQREGRVLNSAVVIDRKGQVAGIYDKLQPVTGSHDYTVLELGVMPGSNLPVFDLDFGRIGIQICFDIGFPIHWQKLAEQDVRMVFWCSAYNGGFPLRAYAALHSYYVVSAVHTDRARIIDPCGQVLAQTDGNANVIWRDINLDFLVCHSDFNYSIPDKIQAGYGGKVEIRSHGDEGMFLVEPIDPAVTTAQLQQEFAFESRAQYLQRHLRAYQQMHQGHAPQPQRAPHGNRPAYGKW